MTELPNRLLRDALDDTLSTPPSTTCVDVERLAAWADDTLTGAERAAIETHAAGCARCLGLLAAMTRTEPPRPERPWWRSPAVWLPLATVTAAIVIVVRLAVIERQARMPAAVASSDLSAIRPSTTSPVPPEAHASHPAGAPAEPSAPAVSSTSASSRRESSGVDAPPPTALAATPKPAQTAAARLSPPPATPELATPAPASPPSSSAQLAAAAPPSPLPPAGETAAKDTAKNTARETAASAVAAPPAPAATPAPGAPPSPLRDEVMARVQGGTNAFAARGMMKTAASAPIVITSPDRESQWRIVGGVVEHTNDGGGTWQTQALGVATPLRSGSAPDARLCWLAGVAGVVLRTTDGATWTRIPFPETADLATIQATDASHATVTTADGRRFMTSDGGASWIRQ